MRKHPVPSLALTACLLLAASACDGDRGAGAEQAVPASENDRAMDGLSPAQIERRAEPMSPERAAELGIIDTTVSVSDEP